MLDYTDGNGSIDYLQTMRSNVSGVLNTETIMVVVNLRYVVLVLYLLTFVFGIIGNTLTITVIVRNKRMKTVATCFILNLAIADNLFMFSLPFFAYSTYTHNWVFGLVMCKFINALYGINLYASIFTMVLMSIDRYLAIVHPLRSIRYRTVKNALCVCLTTWLLCCVIMTPYWMYARTGPGKDDNVRCDIFWPGNFMDYKWFWVYFQVTIGFIIPIIIMVVCYLLLLRHLITDRGPSPDQTRRPIKKVTAMLFFVTVVFVLCWLPYHFVQYSNMQKMTNYMRTGNPTNNDVIAAAILNTIAQTLVFISSCCNPFIYGISSRNFRKFH